MRLIRVFLILASVIFLRGLNVAAQNALKEKVKEAMLKASKFMTDEVSTKHIHRWY